MHGTPYEFQWCVCLGGWSSLPEVGVEPVGNQGRVVFPAVALAGLDHQLARDMVLPERVKETLALLEPDEGIGVAMENERGGSWE